MTFFLSRKLIGRHITLVTLGTNQPICESSITEIFSGILEDVTGEELRIRLSDGTSAVYNRNLVVGLVENKMIGSPSIDSSKEIPNEEGSPPEEETKLQ